MNIIYRETFAAGIDDENNHYPYGVEVCLSYWPSDSQEWKVPSHYVLQGRMMKDRQIMINDCKLIVGHSSDNQNAEVIRQATKKYDELVKILVDEGEKE